MIATVAKTKEILEKYDLYAKKKFGQNFITEPQIISRIISSAKIDEQNDIIEVGPGIGALTEQLCEVSKSVTAFEIDEDMVEVLQNELSHFENLHVIHQDFLKVDLKEALKDKQQVKVVANLPYYITSKLIEKMALEGSDVIQELIVMVQKDVAVKMANSEDLRDRLPLTVFLKSMGSVQLLFDVGRHVFNPAPHVDSSILKITFEKKDQIEDKQHFYQFLQVAFMQRRKTLSNNLKGVKMTKPLKEILAELNLSESVRAEAIDTEDLYTISKFCTF